MSDPVNENGPGGPASARSAPGLLRLALELRAPLEPGCAVAALPFISKREGDPARGTSRHPFFGQY